MHSRKIMQIMHFIPSAPLPTRKKPPRFTPQGFRLREAGIYLFSQAVSSQLSSAQVSLTSVFGMGTGGASPSSTPHAFHSFRAAPDTQKTPEVHTSGVSFARSRHLPIFTGRVQPTIFGTSELNFCVRNGNRWGLTVIDTGRPEYINQLALLFFPDVSLILF